MPTGVHIHNAREQLFAAAERVLLRAGPNALTSRAVTTEADCAKGVLHRHFADFDTFLAELVQDRVQRIGEQSRALRASAGTGTVADNLIEALARLFDSLAVAILPLVTFRDELRARLRASRPDDGLPILTEATAMISDYLTAERELGRIAADADVDSLTLSLVGGAHLLFAGQQSTSPEGLSRMVHTVIADVSQRRLL